MVEKNSAADHSTDGNKMDHLQDDFNALIADHPATEPKHTFPEMPLLQMPDFQIPEHTASKPGTSDDNAVYEEATDAFNDLADAFTTDTPSPIKHSDDSTSSLSHLDQPLSEHDLANEQNSKIAPPDDKFPMFDSDEQTPVSSLPISGHEISTQDSNSFFENEGPAYADLSAQDNDTNNAPKKHIIALVTAILLTTSAGIYWYTTGSTEHSSQKIKSEQFKSAENFTQSSSTETDKNRAENTVNESPKATATDQQKAVSNPVQATAAIPASLSTADAIKLVTGKRAETSGKVVQTKTSPIQVPNPDNWVIIAPVTSKISARLYVKSFKEKGTDSEVLESNKSGSSKYAVRILGFKNKQDAEKQIKTLSSLGFRNAKALKATSAWIPEKTNYSTINRPKTAPAMVRTPKATPSKTATHKATSSTSKRDKTTTVQQRPAATPQSTKNNEPQPVQQVIEFDLDDLL